MLWGAIFRVDSTVRLVYETVAPDRGVKMSLAGIPLSLSNFRFDHGQPALPREWLRTLHMGTVTASNSGSSESASGASAHRTARTTLGGDRIRRPPVAH
jgi:hypothetical protein